MVGSSLRVVATSVNFADIKSRYGKKGIKATKSFPLQDAGKAHEWVESRQSTGKVILHVQTAP